MDILDLVFRARTAELDQANKKLDDTAGKAEKAEKKAKGLGDALGGFSALGGPIGNVADGISDLNDKAETSIGTFGRVGGGITLIGVAAAAAVAGAVKLTLAIADQADALNDLANRTSFSTERLSLMDAMAKMAGSSVEELVSSSERLGAKLAKQDEETGKAVTALKELGISTKDSNGELKSMIQLQEEIVLAADNAANKAKAEGAAVQLLGADYYKLRTAVKETAEQKAEMYDYMQRVGAVVTTKLAKGSDELNDNISKLGLSFKGMGQSIASITVPILNTVITKLSAIAEKAAEIMRRWANPTAGETASDKVASLEAQLANEERKRGGLVYRTQADAIERRIADLQSQIAAAKSDQRQAGQMDERARSAAINGTPGEGNAVAGKTVTSSSSKKDSGSADIADALKREQAMYDEAWKAYEHYVTRKYEADQKQAEAIAKASAEMDKQAEAVRRALDPYYDLTKEVELVNKLYEAGKLSAAEYSAALEANGKKVSETAEKIKQANLEQSEGYKTFTAMVEVGASTLGNVLTDIATGAEVSGKSIARSLIGAVMDMLVIKPMIENLQKTFKSLFDTMGSGSSGSSGGGWMGALFSAIGGMFGGGRATGGVVSAGRFYEVNERRPELLSMGGRDYLMMGSQTGIVKPSFGGTTAAASAPQINVGGIHVTVEGGQDAQRQGQLAGDAAARAFIERIADSRIANALRYGGALNR